MKRVTVFFEGGLVLDCASYEMRDDALVFYDKQGEVTVRIPADAIDTYAIQED